MGFTETMLERYASDVRVAVEHPFVLAAGDHSLAHPVLAEWLAQDRVYALCGYPKFIAQLIAALPLASPRDQRRARPLLTLFVDALANIDREVAFFDSLGPKYGLDLDLEQRSPARLGVSAPPPSDDDSRGKLVSRVHPTTKAYVDLLIATGAEAHGTLDEALVLLWGMEKIYLLAWTHAKSQPEAPGVDADSPTVRALRELVENWTTPEFVAFVDRIESEVENLGLREGTDAWDRCEEMFKYNLLLEQQFWPKVVSP
ncbi:hypothetical protein JCM11491_005266 [Sporobolomyces phaffii]